MFNSVGNIQIGGKWNRSKQRIERPFSGVIAGLVLNGQRVLDLAADKDPRTQIRGDVTLVTSLHERIREPLLQKMQQVRCFPVGWKSSLRENPAIKALKRKVSLLWEEETVCKWVEHPRKKSVIPRR